MLVGMLLLALLLLAAGLPMLGGYSITDVIGLSSAPAKLAFASILVMLFVPAGWQLVSPYPPSYAPNLVHLQLLLQQILILPGFQCIADIRQCGMT